MIGQQLRMRVESDNGAQIAWTLERIEAARVISCVLLVSALGEIVFQPGKADEWLPLAFAVGGLAVVLRPTRWMAILIFGIAVIGPGLSVIRRVTETASIFGVREARVEQQAVFAAGSLVFTVVLLNAILGCWFLIRAGGAYSALLREPVSYLSVFRLPRGMQGFGRGRSGVVVLLLLSGIVFSIGVAGLIDWTLAFYRAFAAELHTRVECYGSVNLFGGQAAIEAIELCARKGRFTYLWSVLGATLLPLAFILCGLRLRTLGRRRYVRGASELMKADERPPIVFLRPFADDRVGLVGPTQLWRRMLWWGPRYATLDELLVLECSQYGPVVAVGRPGERVSTFGVSRAFARDQDWKKFVEELCGKARAIVLVAGITPGLEYELELVSVPENASKAILIAPPSARVPGANSALWQWVGTKTGGRFAADGHCAIAVRSENTGPRTLLSEEFTSIDYVVVLRWLLVGAADTSRAVRSKRSIGVSSTVRIGPDKG